MKLQRVISVEFNSVIIGFDQYSFLFFISNAFLTDFLLKDEKVLERKKLDFALKETIQRQSKACKIVSAFCPELIDE